MNSTLFTKSVTSYGCCFVRLEKRDSDPNQPSPTVYMYKYHMGGNQNQEMIFDLDKNSNMMEDFSSPVAKCNWRDGSIKVLDRSRYANIPANLRQSLADDIHSYWLSQQ